MESLAKLRRKRGTVRAMVSKTITSIEVALAEEEVNVDELQELMERLDVNYAMVRDMDSKIDDLVHEDELEDEINGTLDILNKVTSTKYKVKSQLRLNSSIGMNSSHAAGDASVEDQEIRSTSVDGVSRSNLNVDGRRRRVHVKLPRVEIKKFSGDSSEWLSFWAQYETAIHINDDLTKTEKMVYLKSYLIGDALRAVMGLQISDANYDGAVMILKQRFGRQDAVVNAHMNKLLSLPVVRSSTDVRNLRRLFHVCEVEVRSLESLGISSTMFGSLLCPVLMKSLPEDIAYEYNLNKSVGEWNVDDLLSHLRNVVEAKERTAAMVTKRIENNRVEKNDRSDDRRRNEKRYGSASALQVTAEEKTCIFCKKEHSSFKCKRDLDLKSRLLKRERRCFLCFKLGHMSNGCNVDDKCDRCGRSHHTSLCFAKVKSNVVDEGEPKEDTIVSTTNAKRGCVLLQTANAKLATRKDTMVRILLDGGSETTFVLEELPRRHRFPVIDKEAVNVYTFGSKQPTSTIRRKVQVKLRSLNNDNEVVVDAAETKTITAATIASPSNEIRNVMKRRNLLLAEVDGEVPGFDMKISLLIGSDFIWKVCTGRVERLSTSLVAIETVFGWTLQGRSFDVDALRSESVLLSTKEDKVSTQLRAFWDLEAIGIVDDGDKRSVTDNALLEQFKETTLFVDGRYEVALPWNESKNYLSSNYSVAKRRLLYLAKRFERNEKLFERYRDVVDEQIKHAIAEKVKTTDVGGPLYYLPHQAVIREDKPTTKLRVVFDASSHVDGKPSLNECLESGPNLVPDLISVLLNFRRRRYAFMADIKKAFLQIGVRECDRDALRFLWFTSGWKPGQEIAVNEYRMTRVLFGATCSPYLLAATIRHHINKYRDQYPKIVDQIDSFLYVDDFIGSEASVNDLRTVKEHSTQIMANAGMELTKWSTNSHELSAEWCGKNTSNDEELPVSTDMSSEKVLGLVWRRREDTFSFNVRNLLDFLVNQCDTKRTVLKAVSRIFDPLGFVSPFTIRVKILFQRLWEKGLQWDSELDAKDVDEWRNWCAELKLLEDIEIERCFEDKEVIDKQLHIFCDASEAAYGAVVYIRLVFVDGSVRTKLVISKARVAPIKHLSLPRLELMAAVIASRLKAYLEKVVVDAKFFMWTDAMIVLHWIRGASKRWKPFVANRISEIHASTNPQAWLHCSGIENPADKLTRGVTLKDLVVDVIWWRGPKWLLKDKEKWPQKTIDVVDEAVSSELRKVFVSTTVTKNVDPVVDELSYERRKGPLAIEEIQESERYWIRNLQRRTFSMEIEALKNQKELSSKSVLFALKVYVDCNGLLRIGGRLHFSDIEEHVKHPLVLPRYSNFTRLVVVDAHERVKHLSVQSTLTQLRDRFYIPRGRQLVRSLLRQCVVCRRLNAQPFNEIYAPLPADRCSTSTPFDVVGVDFAGPLIERSGNKVYILLVTCASTRAVHLELVTSMNTEATIMALKRFIGRRGVPSTIYSDNGRTFKRVDVELSALWKCFSSTTVKDYLCGLRISWKFIAERSPWWGGFWERMVRTVKTALKKCIGKASLNFEELLTILVECEAVVNSRPLTFVYVDENEAESLTPAHLLIGNKLTTLPSTRIEKKVSVDDRSELVKRWKYRQRLADHYWRRWRNEYLLELRSAMESKGKSSTKPMVGDIVLVKEDNIPRLQWNMARVVEVIVGRDGKVRACKVKLGKGNTVCRSIQRLFPLEVSSKSDGTSTVSMGGGCCESSTNDRLVSINIDSKCGPRAKTVIKDDVDTREGGVKSQNPK